MGCLERLRNNCSIMNTTLIVITYVNLQRVNFLTARIGEKCKMSVQRRAATVTKINR